MSSGALGRGLASLIPPLPEKKEPSSYFFCAIEKVVPNRDQPRKLFSKESLDELADSIRENGVIQPLIVRKLEGGQYELIAGERRLRASKLAGLLEVPVVILESAPEQNLELALIENIQRQDLNPIEEALAYKQLIERYHYTQEQCSKKVGKDRSSVANALRLLGLSEQIRGFIVEGKLSMGHARALLGIDDEKLQHQAALKIIEEGLSVREIEQWVRRVKNLQQFQEKDAPVLPPLNPQLRFIQEEMTKILGTKVQLKQKGNKGQVLIEYCSAEDLDRIFNALIG